MFQTTNLDAHAYTSDSLISLHNNKCSPEMIEYIKNTYSYTIPQNNNYRTLIINKNVFRSITHFNLFVISPEIFDDNPIVVLNIMINYLSNLIRSMNKNSKLANTVDFKLYLYYGDDIEMPFGYVKEDLYDEDLFGNKINDKLRLYIRNFRFTDEGELKFHLPLNQDTFTQLLQKCHKSTFHTTQQSIQPLIQSSQPSVSQSFIQPTQQATQSFIQPPSQPSQSFIQPSVSTQSSFIQPSSQPSQSSFIQPSQPSQPFQQQPFSQTNTFGKTPSSFSSSVNTFAGSNPFNAVKPTTTFPSTFGIK